MIKTLLKASGIWVAMVVSAILNGLFRQYVLIPGLGESKALPLSGIFLSLFIFTISVISIGSLGKLRKITCFYIGAFWVVLTLIFEVVLGRLISGRSWAEIFEVFNLFEGNLFILVLLTTFLSPWITVKLRKLI